MTDRIFLMLALGVLAGCASTAELVDAPVVDLQQVEVTELGFSGQTFVLLFNVANPNPFPLPVSTIEYGLQLDGQRFASGATDGGFSIPAAGQTEIAISVELDLLRTSPPLLYTVRDSLKRDIPYELEGRLGLDIPMVKPLRFRSSGAVRFSEIGRQALQLP